MSTQDYEILLKVRADLQQALGKIGDLNKGIRGIGDTARDVAGIVGISFGVHEIVDFAKSIIDAQAHMVDLNQQTGISVENLSALQFIAHKNGIEIDALGGSLAKLANEAAKNNPAFAAMGISVKDSTGHLKDTSALLEEVAKKFAGYQDGPEKAALANALFGKSGFALIQMLDQLGTEGLDRVKQKAKEAGALLGGDTARQAKQFADSLDDLKVSAKNAVAQGIDAMLPEMQHLVDLAKDPEAQQGLQAIGEGIGFIGTEAGKAIINLSELITNLAQVAAFRKTGIVLSDAAYGAAVDQSDAIRAELARRQNAPLSGYGGALSVRMREVVAPGNPLMLSPTDNAEAIRTAGLALKSDAELKNELANLTTQINSYRAQSNKDAAAAAAAQRKNMDDAAGDVIGDIIGGGKPRAPLVSALGGAAAIDNAKALAAAFAQLQSQLASLKTQGLDPTAAAWAQYNKTVADATDTAKKAGDTPEALATLKAIETEAARIRDAQLDKIADQDRQAWEQFRASLGNPLDVRTEQAIAKIKNLGHLIEDLKGKAGAPGALDFSAALSAIIEQSLQRQPHAQSAGGLPGGVDTSNSLLGQSMRDQGAEDDWYAQSRKTLEKERQAALEQYKDDREKELQIQRDFDAKQEQLSNQHAAATAQIQQAQYWGEVQMASEAFGQLAQVWAQRYGTENKTYAVLFALSKTFAIAQAAVSLATNVAKASEVGFPYNIPFIIGAFAQGAEIAALIAGANFSGGGAGGGYAGGGAIHGPGTATSDSVPILASNGEYMQRAAAVSYYGVPFMDAVNNLRYPRYADGGLVHPMANAPSPAELGFVTPPRPGTAELQAAAEDKAPARQPQSLRVVVVLDKQDIANAMTGAEGERVHMLHAKANIPTLRTWFRDKG